MPGEARGRVNFGTVFNGMFLADQRICRIRGGPRLNELPPGKLQAITKFLRTRNRTPQKALFVALT
jgi:hypothetical protein